MALNYLFLIAIYYVVVQCALMFDMRGGWRVAAFLPIPIISLSMCISVLPGILDPITSTLLMMYAVPVGTAYLVSIAAAWVVLQRKTIFNLQRKTSAP